jgi:hypothetical protein
MDLKLEELRKRLLQPVPASPTSYPTLESGREVWSASPLFSQQSPTENSQDTRHRRASAPEENPSERSAAEIMSLTESAHQNTGDQAAAVATDVDVRGAAAVPKVDGRADGTPANELARAIDNLFEPVRHCLGEIPQACEAVSQLTRPTLEMCQPLRNFRDHLQRLSGSFASMRTFRYELDVLAESVEPIGVLNRQTIQLEDAVQAQLAEVVKTLESTKTLRMRIAELGRTVDSASELEAQFLELSRNFGAASRTNRESTEPAEDARSMSTRRWVGVCAVKKEVSQKIATVKFRRKGYRLEDREMEGYAMSYRAYLARRDLPGPEPTFADFVEIHKMQARIAPEDFLALNACRTGY